MRKRSYTLLYEMSQPEQASVPITYMCNIFKVIWFYLQNRRDGGNYYYGDIATVANKHISNKLVLNQK